MRSHRGSASREAGRLTGDRFSKADAVRLKIDLIAASCNHIASDLQFLLFLVFSLSCHPAPFF